MLAETGRLCSLWLHLLTPSHGLLPFCVALFEVAVMDLAVFFLLFGDSRVVSSITMGRFRVWSLWLISLVGNLPLSKGPDLISAMETQVYNTFIIRGVGDFRQRTVSPIINISRTMVWRTSSPSKIGNQSIIRGIVSLTTEPSKTLLLMPIKQPGGGVL